MTLADLDQPHRVRRSELIALFGLTDREADVAALLGEGASLDDAARRLEISEHTVRQHLKAVFGKVGVSRQAELVRIISRLA
ncbi:helix-turn-helix domain-containing protein [Phenylobacterium aquaticum]|uniref:helix-turn-helix domain-containing protein n=1 Tax=Phenylobacterium aquaticum TaxID=1763816 RepID=UPI001F5D01E9|nr:helix-turn-helix transcriptional regulator [Phenylobacterium aquaticum]MCI3135241.1 helix-turn-helix transcriptional regulator [Phenylobacterium aquaticum]